MRMRVLEVIPCLRLETGLLYMESTCLHCLSSVALFQGIGFALSPIAVKYIHFVLTYSRSCFNTVPFVPLS
jgi:hypothetical protein